MDLALDRVLAALPARGITEVDVVCPAFAVDCLETLEEIAIAGRATFIAAGGDLLQPWFLTFGQTDPSTLVYGGAAVSANLVAVPEPARAMLICCAALVLFARSNKHPLGRGQGK